MGHPHVLAYLENRRAEILSDDDDLTKFNLALLPAAHGYGEIQYPAPNRVFARLAVASVTSAKYDVARTVRLDFGMSVGIDMGQTPALLFLDCLPQIIPGSYTGAEEVLEIIFDDAEHGMRIVMEKVFGSSQLPIDETRRFGRADKLQAMPRGYRPH